MSALSIHQSQSEPQVIAMLHPYATEAYAKTLFHIGRPVPVPEWGCHVLARPIAGGGEDIVGCYPLAILNADADLRGGLARLKTQGFVSATLTLDDVHRPSVEKLNEAFDLVRAFKTHYVLTGGIQNYAPSGNHRYKINRAYKMIKVKPIDLALHINEWCGLYDALIERRDVSDLHVFSSKSFAMLAEVPGVHAIAGFIANEMVACHVWVRHEADVVSHLTASNARGYEFRAAYAVNDGSIKHFADATLLDFGGGAGLIDDPNNGLARFKRGFSNAQTSAWICGAVLDPGANARLIEKAGVPVGSNYFPIYRARAHQQVGS